MEGIYEGVFVLPDILVNDFYETGTAIGEGAAVALNPELTDNLNAIYGVDVEAWQRALLFTRTTMAITGAGAVGKTGAGVADAVAEAVSKKLDNILASAGKKGGVGSELPDRPVVLAAASQAAFLRLTKLARSSRKINICLGEGPSQKLNSIPATLTRYGHSYRKHCVLLMLYSSQTPI
ncbi:hypothetical protein [Pseudomonas caspiana]|uniref:hypothetical protein n=1 Tax=Pseudomonas caspiana TaxID=1451454 RepID=UPI0032EBC2BA